MWAKQNEFYTWLHEVRKLDPEIISRPEMKTYFQDFMEAYNTATLPNKKYYDMEAWTKKEMAKKDAAKNAVQNFSTGLLNDPFAFNDEDRLRAERQKMRSAQQISLDRRELQDMARVMRERREEEYKKKVGLRPDENKGVRWGPPDA
eukprot:comp23144_c4_seq6/m.37398 comp23144_c4_seq6/g.37398  ORF comp23144_c4_seq6/g.37398 comp23144_c4_seq6/m.37398 type:complete len:147 (-) comp23144_c4_seq6:24-464(-)